MTFSKPDACLIVTKKKNYRNFFFHPHLTSLICMYFLYKNSHDNFYMANVL